MKERVPDLDWYGRGVRDLAAKWEGLLPYRYSVVLENGVLPDYWTEKLADAILAWSVPIYCGATNIRSYFPADVMEAVDLDSPAEAADKIRRLVESDDYERRLPALEEARRRILDRHNVFNLMFDFAKEHFVGGPGQTVTLTPEPQPGKWGRRLEKWRRRYFT